MLGSRLVSVLGVVLLLVGVLPAGRRLTELRGGAHDERGARSRVPRSEVSR
jgi:hypothetical protein